MAAKKKKKAAKAKKAPAKKSKKVKTAKKTAKKASKKAVKRPARKTKKTVKAAAKKAPAKKAKKKTAKKNVYGEGNYEASRAFDKDQASFVARNKSRIPAMGKAAEAELDGPQGDMLRDAEAAAAGRSRDTFEP